MSRVTPRLLAVLVLTVGPGAATRADHPAHAANDPHGEHDFGAFEFDGTPVMFKIDYYDKDLAFHSPDPADPTVTERVITLMLAEEY